MRRLPLILLLAVTLASQVFPQSGRRTVTRLPTAPVQPPVNPEPELPPPKTAPSNLLFLPESLLERRIRSLNRNSFRLADFHGKVLVINLWATWCGPCRREIPEYEKVRKHYQERNVEFIGLTTEDPNVSFDRVNNFVRETGFGFLIGWADREMARVLTSGKRGIPQTLVIDTEGRVVNHWAGYSPRFSGERLKESIANALK